jgi:hypothetical protein
MKILKILLTSTLLVTIPAMAMTSKIKEGTKTVYTVLEGDSKDRYSKPGLAVNLSYKSEHVGVGEASDVNITITTALSEGTLKVKLKALENDEWDLEEKNLEFKLSKTENSFPINLQLSSENEGQYYLSVFVSLEGEGGRVFEVPVNIGNIKEKLSTKAVEITDKGTAVTSSAAEEEIK